MLEFINKIITKIIDFNNEHSYFKFVINKLFFSIFKLINKVNHFYNLLFIYLII